MIVIVQRIFDIQHFSFSLRMDIISTKKIFLLFTALLSLLTAAVMLGFKDDIFNRILSWVNIEKM